MGFLSVEDQELYDEMGEGFSVGSKLTGFFFRLGSFFVMVIQDMGRIQDYLKK